VVKAERLLWGQSYRSARLGRVQSRTASMGPVVSIWDVDLVLYIKKRYPEENLTKSTLMSWLLCLSVCCMGLSGCQGLKRPKGLKEETIRPRVGNSRWDQKFNNVGKLFGNVAVFSSQPEESQASVIKKALWTATIQTLGNFTFETIDPDTGMIETAWFSLPKKPNQRFKICCAIANHADWVKSIQVKAYGQMYYSGQWHNQLERRHLAFDIKDCIITTARHRYAGTHAQESILKSKKTRSPKE